MSDASHPHCRKCRQPEYACECDEPDFAKPLWQQFAEMTPEQVATEQAAEFARLEAGTMTEAERHERVAAWRKAGEWQHRQADVLEAEHRRRRTKRLGLRLV